MALRRTSDSPRLRVLHVVGGLDRGGVETWLRRVSPLLRQAGVDSDFLVHEDREYAYSAALRTDGAKILVCPKPQQRIRYAVRLYRILHAGEPYDVVHGHVQGFNALVLAVARLAGVRTRVFHSHTAHPRTGQRVGAVVKRRAASWLARLVSSDLAAVSDNAAESAFGANRSAAIRVLPGIDFDPFLRIAQQREAVARPRPTILHVGRFEIEKNHDLILDVAAAVKSRQPAWAFLLVGSGSLLSHVDRRVREEGLHNVRLVEPRDDLSSVFAEGDVFILPSRYEGLGLVALEAQAAGLPTVLSGEVPPEAVLPGASIHRLDSFDVRLWIEAIEAALATDNPSATDLRHGAEASAVGISTSMKVLLSVYNWPPDGTDENNDC
jgi:glycosyltransferase involved in cell wall biosynthesis